LLARAGTRITVLMTIFLKDHPTARRIKRFYERFKQHNIETPQLGAIAVVHYLDGSMLFTLYDRDGSIEMQERVDGNDPVRDYLYEYFPHDSGMTRQ